MRYGIVLALLVAASVARAFTVDIDATLTDEVKKKLDKREAVVCKNKIEDKGEKVVSNSAALIVINAPVEKVWPYFTDFEKFPEYIPRMVSSEKYTEKDGKIGIKQMLKVMWKKVTYHVLQLNDEAHHTMTFELDKSQQNDVAETQGQWVLRPYGEGKTLAVYSLALDTGMAVPRFIQTMLLNNDLPATMEAMRDRVESGGKYVKK